MSRVQQKYKIGDRVKINAVEGRPSYISVFDKIGTIKKVKYDDFFGTPSYTYWVQVDECTNEYQQEGLYVFNKDKSLTLVASTNKEKIMKSEVEKNMNNSVSVFGTAALVNDPICTQPSIIDEYLNKKRATYERERDEAIRKVNEASSIGKAITTFIAALKKAGLKDEMLPNFNMLWNDNCLTDAEKAALKDVYTVYHIAMTKLHENCRECVAILANCETFEQKMTVLQKYDIIDSDYKLKA